MEPTSATTRPGFRKALEGGGFLLGAELVTTRGITPPEPAAGIVRLAADLLASPRVAWISITDNPGGNIMLPPDWLARRLTEERDRIVLHLSCKDLNRNAIESTLWRYASEGFRNILALTGDAPREGANRVFDLDSVTLLALLSAMNAGLTVPGRKGEPVRLAATDFFAGCAVSPFKALESELVPQYFKLVRKIGAGARFIIPQLGYDVRKAHEILVFLASRGLKVPVIGNVYLLNKTVAEMFHRGDIPGCVVSGPLLELARKQAAAPDKGKGFFRDLAARQVAAFRALGFAGAYLGGMSKAEDFQDVIARADKYSEADGRAFAKEIQYAQENEFYLYEQNPDTGLGDPARLNPAHVKALASPPRTAHVGFDYTVNRLFHRQFFLPGKGFYKTLQSFYRKLDKATPKTVQRVQALERLMKTAFCGCKGCGDCALPECAYLCPRSACAKNQRNGPCGGSHGGTCECRDVTCLWVRAFERLRYAKELEAVFGAPPVPYDAGLEGSPSWANFYLGRDHHKKARDEKNVSTPIPRRESMPLPNLSIIGESINDSVPSTQKLYDANDINGLLELAKSQAAKGAVYLDVNVGRRTPDFMADMVRKIQAVTDTPLSIDTPDPEIARAGLAAYDPARAKGKPPILNSISPLRLAMFDLCRVRPLMPILMVSERVENGVGQPNATAEETHRTAKEMLRAAREHGIPNEHCLIDCGIAPIGSDTEGNLKRLLAALKLLQDDPDFKGCHRSVGLSNFTVMLPPKRKDGSPVKGPLESAFLTKAMPLGLDWIIGSMSRKYEILTPDHPAMACLEDVLRLDGFDAVMRVKDFYAS